MRTKIVVGLTLGVVILLAFFWGLRLEVVPSSVVVAEAPLPPDEGAAVPGAGVVASTLTENQGLKGADAGVDAPAEPVSPEKVDPEETARREAHAKLNSGYGTKVELAAEDDEGERRAPFSAGRGAPEGELEWEEEAPAEEACHVTVQVRAEDPDAELGGVLIHVRRQEKYTTVLTAFGRTDRGGVLEIRGLPIAWYRVSLEDDDALPATRAYRCDGGETKRIELFKQTGDARLFGRVLEEGTEEPLAGAEVTLQEITNDKDDKDFKVATQLTVDDEGGFDAVVRGGKSWQFRVYAQVPGYEFTNADVFLQANEHKRITFFLKPIGRVEGLVLTSSGVPAGGARVSQGGPGSLVGTDADEHGKFSMPARPGSSLTLAAHSGHEVGVIALAPLAEGETRAALVIQLAAGRTVEGLVRGSKGEPFPYAEVFVSSSGGGGGWLSVVQADGDARFLAPGAPATALEAFARLPSIRSTRSMRTQVEACPPGDGACATTPVEIELTMPVPNL